MSRTPIDPRLVRTKEQEERSPVLLQSLCALFRPFVEPVAAPKIAAIMAQPLDFDEETVATVVTGLRDAVAAGEIPDATPEDLSSLEREMRNPTPPTPEENAQFLKEEVDEAVARLVTAWIDCIILGIPGDIYDQRTLDAATVGDDMFPPIDPEIAGTFDECCAQADLTPDEARGILRAVRTSLPAGKAMPDDAVELFRLHRLTVA